MIIRTIELRAGTAYSFVSNPDHARCTR